MACRGRKLCAERSARTAQTRNSSLEPEWYGETCTEADEQDTMTTCEPRTIWARASHILFMAPDISLRRFRKRPTHPRQRVAAGRRTDRLIGRKRQPSRQGEASPALVERTPSNPCRSTSTAWVGRRAHSSTLAASPCPWTAGSALGEPTPS